MVYFIVATLMMYEGDMKWDEKIISPGEFERRNPNHIQRVFEECRNVFNYELSFNQMMMGVSAYMKAKLRPQKVSETEPYNPNENGSTSNLSFGHST